MDFLDQLVPTAENQSQSAVENSASTGVQPTTPAAVEPAQSGPEGAEEGTQPQNSAEDDTNSQTSDVQSEAQNEVKGDEANVGNVESSEGKPKYPNVVDSFSSMDEARAKYPVLYNVTDFAAQVTLRNIHEGKGVEGFVIPNNIYTATKAVRHPLPVVLVDGTAYLPETAFDAYAARPARGEGGTGTSGGKLDDDELLVAAGRASYKLDERKRFLAIQQEKLKQAESLYNKRSAQLSARNLTWEDAQKAYTESEAAKDAGKEISDSDEKKSDSADNE